MYLKQCKLQKEKKTNKIIRTANDLNMAAP